MIIAIDFDGTIVDDKFPEIGTLKKGAKEAINKLYSEGYYIIIWTSRCAEQLLDAVVFLAVNDIKFNAVNKNCPINMAKYGGNPRKVYADVYIDDNGLYDLPVWDDIYKQIIAIPRPRTYADKVINEGYL
jgi:hypothetical protein